MSILSIQDSNALLFYRVGPVLMCSPTLPVEAVIMPPKITVPPGANVAEPGVFKSMHGIVRLVDLRVRFGVDDADKSTPGKVVVVEVEGGHAGFWVDEIEDVVGFPATGWSQVSSHIPKNVFTRTLMHKDDIRLYADFEELDKLKSTGYLRKHIEVLKNNNKISDEAKVIPLVEKNESAVEQSRKYASIKSRVTSEVYVKNAQKISANISSDDGDKNKKIIKVDSEIKNKIELAVNKKRSDFSAPLNLRSSWGKKNDVNKVNVGYLEGKKTSEIKSRRQRLGVDESVKVNSSIQSSSRQVEGGLKKVKFNSKSNQKKNESSQSVVEESAGGVFFYSLLGLLALLAAYFVFDLNVEEGGQPVVVKYESSILGVGDESVLKVDVSTLHRDSIIAVQNEYGIKSKVETGSVEISKNDDGLLIVVNEYVDEIKENDVAGKLGSKSESVEIGTEALEAENELDLSTGSSIEELGNESDVSIKTQSENKIDEEKSEKKSHLNVLGGKPEVSSNIDSSDGLRVLEETLSLGVVSMGIDKGGRAEIQENQNEVLALNESVTEKKVSKFAVKSKMPSKKYIHYVVKGDTLWHIAKRYVNNPWRYPELARLSNIKNPDLIYPGNKVTIIINYKVIQ